MQWLLFNCSNILLVWPQFGHGMAGQWRSCGALVDLLPVLQHKQVIASGVLVPGGCEVLFVHVNRRTVFFKVMLCAGFCRCCCSTVLAAPGWCECVWRALLIDAI
jgi:hypothetical protein